MTDTLITGLNEMLTTRYSVRGFKPDLVPQAKLEEIFKTTQLYPSNCNTQPVSVFVASGEKCDDLREKMNAHIMSGQPPAPAFKYFDKFEGDHRDRQYACAMALYGAMGVKREDRAGRQAAMLRNFAFFGAPHVAFICIPKSFDKVNAIDVGIYLQTLMLVMKAHGVDSCAQGALGYYPDPVKEFFDIDENLGVIVGLSFGYEEVSEPANKARTERASMEDVVTFL